MNSLPDRSDWLNPDDDDNMALGTSQVEVEVSPTLLFLLYSSDLVSLLIIQLDERWLLTEDELAALEDEFSG
jgi:hypothetical protein